MPVGLPGQRLFGVTFVGGSGVVGVGVVSEVSATGGVEESAEEAAGEDGELVEPFEFLVEIDAERCDVAEEEEVERFVDVEFENGCRVFITVPVTVTMLVLVGGVITTAVRHILAHAN